MTCREKLKIEHPTEVGSRFVGGCCGCPHHFGYLDRPKYCDPDAPKAINKCTKCWDREIPGTEETKEKNMELNEKFAKMTFAELVDTASSYEKEIENLREDNNRLGTMISNRENVIENIKVDLERKDEEIDRLIENAVNKDEKISLLLKDNQYVRDANRLSAEKDKEKIESLEKDVSNYRDIIAMRDRRLDEKEADIHNLRETIEFYERHTNRIEGELKLYKGMKVDTNKTDYTNPKKVEPLCKYVPSNRVIATLESVIIEEEGIRATILLTEEAAECFMPNGRLPNLGSDIKVCDFAEPDKLRTMPDIDEMHENKGHNDPVGEPGEPGEPGIPICTTVPSSAVIGKIHCLKANWVVDEEPHVVFKLPKDAVKKLTGKDNWSNIDYLIMPTDMYKDVLNKDLEEHMKRYRDMIDQYKYYSRVLDNPCLNITPDHNSNPIPPVAKDYKAIGEHIHRKFAALMDAGFTEDQAMSLIPMWTDDDEEN